MSIRKAKQKHYSKFHIFVTKLKYSKDLVEVYEKPYDFRVKI